MENTDKPLGAPNLNADTHSASNDSPQPVAPKRKLNWKGFGIGIIAVIIIEFFAITMLQQGDPQIALVTPTPKPTAPVDKVAETMVSITKHGGLCQTGKECSSSRNILADGTIQNGKETKKLTPEQTKKLKDLIASTDFAAIKAKPFLGTCPIAYDGQETTYLFYTNDGAKEEIPSCKYEIDPNQPLIKFINENVLK